MPLEEEVDENIMISFEMETDEEDEHKKGNNIEDEGNEEHFEDKDNVEDFHIQLEELC